MKLLKSKEPNGTAYGVTCTCKRSVLWTRNKKKAKQKRYVCFECRKK